LRLQDYSFLNRTLFDLGDFGPLQVRVKNVISYEHIRNNTAGPADGIGGLAQNAGAFNTAGVGGNNTNGRTVVAQLGPYAKILTNDFKVEIDGFDKALVSTVGYFYQKTQLPATTRGTGNIYTIFGATTTPFLNYLSAQGFQAGSYAKQTGVYAQATVDFSNLLWKGLKVTGGYRYSTDQQVDRRYAAVITYPQATYAPGTTRTETRLKTDGYNYNLSVTQDIGDDIMVYASQTRAYIPGGINVLIQGNTNLPNYKPIFDPQTIVAREVGAKYDFRIGDMVGRLNAAAYFYDFKDIAVGFSGFTGTASVGYTANVAAAELKGFELYGNIVPLPNWQVRGSYNHNDASYTKWLASDPFNAARPGGAVCSPQSQPQTCLIDLKNNPFQRMPEHQGNLTVVYSPPIDESRGSLALSASLYAQSQVWFNSAAYRHLQVLPTAKPGISQKAYSVLNLRADWSDVWGLGFDAAVFVNNATDEVYKNGTTAQLLTLGYAIATYAPPRMMGIEIGKRF
jgi:iron complex outermembrane receptor protein